MVATPSHVSSSSWGPATRTLSAVFAGSAVMFAAAMWQGGTLLPVAERTGAETSVGADAGQSVSGTGAVSPSSTAGQATPWAPGATPDWGGSLQDLPVHRAPVQPAPVATSLGTQTAESTSSDAAPGTAGSTTDTSDITAGTGSPAPAEPDGSARGSGPEERPGLFGGILDGLLGGLG